MRAPSSLFKWTHKCSEYCQHHWIVQLFPNCGPTGFNFQHCTVCHCNGISIFIYLCLPIILYCHFPPSFECNIFHVQSFLTCPQGVLWVFPCSAHLLLILSPALVLWTSVSTAGSYYLITFCVSNYTAVAMAVSSFITLLLYMEF